MEADKTAFIHFVRPLQPSQGPWNHLAIGNKAIGSKRSGRVWIITLDSGASMNEHVSKAVAKAIGKRMALRITRGVRPPQMQLLYIRALVLTIG